VTSPEQSGPRYKEQRMQRLAILRRRNEGAKLAQLCREFSLGRSVIHAALRQAQKEVELAAQMSEVLQFPVDPGELDERSMEWVIAYRRTLHELFGWEEGSCKEFARWLGRKPYWGPVRIARIIAYLETLRM